MVNSEYDAQSVNSAAPSITSINSLASLLKEKMQVRFTLGIEFVTAFSLLLILKNLHFFVHSTGASIDDQKTKEAKGLQDSSFCRNSLPRHRLSSQSKNFFAQTIF